MGALIGLAVFVACLVAGGILLGTGHVVIGFVVLLCSLPLSHTFGQTCVMGVAFHRGATVVLLPRFTATAALESMLRHGCTVFMGVPTM